MNYRLSISLLVLCASITHILAVPKITKEVNGNETIYRLTVPDESQTIMGRQSLSKCGGKEIVITACFQYYVICKQFSNYRTEATHFMEVIDVDAFYDLQEEYNKQQELLKIF